MQKESEHALYHAANRFFFLNNFPEYAGNLGEAGDNDWRDQENAHILQLVDRF